MLKSTAKTLKQARLERERRGGSKLYTAMLNLMAAVRDQEADDLTEAQLRKRLIVAMWEAQDAIDMYEGVPVR